MSLSPLGSGKAWRRGFLRPRDRPRTYTWSSPLTARRTRTTRRSCCSTRPRYDVTAVPLVTEQYAIRVLGLWCRACCLGSGLLCARSFPRIHIISQTKPYVYPEQLLPYQTTVFASLCAARVWCHDVLAHRCVLSTRTYDRHAQTLCLTCRHARSATCHLWGIPP